MDTQSARAILRFKITAMTLVPSNCYFEYLMPRFPHYWKRPDGIRSPVAAVAIALSLWFAAPMTHAAIPAPPAFAANYQLKFSQDFAAMTNYSQLSVSAQGPCGPGGTTWMAHKPRGGDWFTFIDPVSANNPFNVGNGCLTIRVAVRGYGDPNKWFSGYSGGLLSSVDNQGRGFAQKYGYFECSMQTPAGANTWPAFWLLSSPSLTNASLKTAELDVIESYGNWGTSTNYSPPGDPNNYQIAWHDWMPGGTNTGGQFNVLHPGGATAMTTGYHTYGVDVEPSGIKWYFDRNLVWQSPIYASAQAPLYLLVNLALGGGSHNNSTGTGYNWSLTPNPTDLKVQYMAVWASPNSPNYIVSPRKP